jgi:hypothetical protein
VDGCCFDGEKNCELNTWISKIMDKPWWLWMEDEFMWIAVQMKVLGQRKIFFIIIGIMVDWCSRD